MSTRMTEQSEITEFSDSVIQWLRVYQLDKSWEHRIDVREIGSDRAQVAYCCESKSAVFTINTVMDDTDSEFDPSRSARHEVLHVLFADMLFAAAKSGDVCSPYTLSAEHEVINKIIYGV